MNYLSLSCRILIDTNVQRCLESLVKLALCPTTEADPLDRAAFLPDEYETSDLAVFKLPIRQDTKFFILLSNLIVLTSLLRAARENNIINESLGENCIKNDRIRIRCPRTYNLDPIGHMGMLYKNSPY